MRPSASVEEWIRAEVEKLDGFYSRVMTCHVTVEMPHRHHRNGSPYHIQIDLTVPGEEIVVKREPSFRRRAIELGQTTVKKHLEPKKSHKELRLAINDAFRAVGRRLQDYVRRQRGDIKSHLPLQVAQVGRILQGEGYGFLTSADGRGIYFHKNSVLNRAFSKLKVGTRVSFIEELGEKGPHARTVRVVSKTRIQPPSKQAAALGD
jgi:cold shock CspA family protein